MTIFRARATLAAVTATFVAVAGGAIGQQVPESLLPPGFGDPVAQPTASPTAAVPPADADLPTALPSPVSTPTALPSPTAAERANYEMPVFARRSLDAIGPVGPDDNGFAPTAFGTADGRFLETLMRRLDAPVASRWMEIALRRLLVSRLATPVGVNGPDFAAERAWLLLRLGEADGARAVVQGVDVGVFTPKYHQMVMQAALATGDPALLCPHADTANAYRVERAWMLARGMCAGLAGTPGRVRPIFDAARRQGFSGIDLLLARKVAGAGAGGRQSVTIEWAGVDRLTSWRYGLATATAVEIPPDLLDRAGPRVTAWRATSPVLPPRLRIAPALAAAPSGVVSSAALVDLYGAIDPDDDPADAVDIARDIGAAYSAASGAQRLAAIQRLWAGPADDAAESERFARLILTAGAATRVPVDTTGADTGKLVASMLSAGHDRSAARWRGAAERGSEAWALLSLADPRRASVGLGDVDGYADGRKRRLFFAGLAGLRRMSGDDIQRGAEALGVRIGAANAWTRAIDAAARTGQRGTVVLLAAVGMQTPDWRGVSPEALYRVVAALHAVGLDGYARMVAAEAVMRA